MASFDGISHRLVLEELIKKHGFKRIAEIGVDKGNTFLYLLRTCPEITMLGVDTWEKIYAQYELPVRKTARERFRDRALLIKATSVDAAKDIKDASLDLVFIDADHSEESVRQDIVAWRRKVRPGGILCGHDVNQEDVKKAVTALCPGWTLHEQAVWSIQIHEPFLMTAIPYANDHNLGRACNEIMSRLPVDGYACLLDHDVMFTTLDWHRQLTDAIIRQPDGCFSALTNRIRCPFQRVRGISMKNHDIAYHRDIGEKLMSSTTLRDVTNSTRTPSGLIMVLSKQAWKETGGFPEGLHYVDRLMWMALKLSGRKIFVHEGVYLYHWHRAGHEAFQEGQWAERHVLPNGIAISLADTPRPVYGHQLKVKQGKDVFAFECKKEVEQWRVQTMFTKEPGTIRWLRRVVKPRDIVYDIGANIGIYSLFAAARCIPGGTVYAFEPHTFTAASLLKNIQLNHVADVVKVITSALHETEKYSSFNYQHLIAGTSGSQFDSVIDESGKTFIPDASEIKHATTIDRLVKDGVILPPQIVKIDVDGNEHYILHGMLDQLRAGTIRSIQVEIHESNKLAVGEFLGSCGYTEVENHNTILGEEAIARGYAASKVFYNAVFERM